VVVIPTGKQNQVMRYHRLVIPTASRVGRMQRPTGTPFQGKFCPISSFGFPPTRHGCSSSDELGADNNINPICCITSSMSSPSEFSNDAQQRDPVKGLIVWPCHESIRFQNDKASARVSAIQCSDEAAMLDVAPLSLLFAFVTQLCLL
jgi:hypothetical protein